MHDLSLPLSEITNCSPAATVMMRRPFPPLSPSISPTPAQQSLTTVTPPHLIFYFFSFIPFIVLVIILAILLGKFIGYRWFPDSPFLTPTDTTATATNALELLKSGHIIIYIDDCPLSTSTPYTEARPSDESGSCPICWEEVAEGEGVRVLPRCRHAYHRACIDQWLIMGSHCCPLCRDRLTVRLAERKIIDPVTTATMAREAIAD